MYEVNKIGLLWIGSRLFRLLPRLWPADLSQAGVRYNVRSLLWVNWLLLQLCWAWAYVRYTAKPQKCLQQHGIRSSVVSLGHLVTASAILVQNIGPHVRHTRNLTPRQEDTLTCRHPEHAQIVNLTPRPPLIWLTDMQTSWHGKRTAFWHFDMSYLSSLVCKFSAIWAN